MNFKFNEILRTINQPTSDGGGQSFLINDKLILTIAGVIFAGRNPKETKKLIKSTIKKIAEWVEDED